MEQTYVPHPPSPSVPMVPIQPFDMPTTPEARRSEDGGSSRRDSPSAVELTRSRENSMHNGEGALSNMTREMQLALYPMFMCEDRHESADLGREPPGTSEELVSKWRMKDRMKTMSVALILCLNIGVDPPDVLKISPCARMQCWINPLSMQPQKALDAIGKALQAQYERWQPRAKYKLQLDPTVEDVKKLCVSCRRNAKNERVLLHYNGHGVPRPTVNGEVWVFNKSYTQYIPLSIYDLQAWTGNPAIYVFDCSGAGLVVNSFLQLAQHGGGSGSSGSNGSVMGTGAAAAALNAASAAARRETGEDTMGGAMPLGSGMNEVILLAACGAEELLPQSAELPADLFSACLTTPIKIALQWFCSRSILKGHSINPDIIDKIPGQQNNRKTPLGELNWIFTAITDTIAWNVLPRPLFQRLFRQDLLVASLFRNFLLADRIMRANNCTPISCPALPPTYQHPMWHAWDMAVEICLLQMPALISGDPAVEFTPSPFFTEQLTAFEVWLEHGSEQKPPPEQLPIVLQVLLSQSHRLRALVLLGRFLDMGPWAVDLALSVGIFPYVLKLLQTTAPDLRQILVFIWTKILALDRSCQQDLVKDNSHVYFIRFLDSPQVPSEERAMAAFVLAAIADDHPKGQAVCASSGLLHICLNNLPAAASPGGSPLFVRWLCLCVGKLWENNSEIQAEAIAARAVESVASLLAHPTPDVRAAAVFALGALVRVPDAERRDASADRDGDDHHARENITGFDADERVAAERAVAMAIVPAVSDASPLVRAEAAAALGRVTRAHAAFFQSAASWARRHAREGPPPSRSQSFGTAGHLRQGSSVGQVTLEEVTETLASSSVEEDGREGGRRDEARGGRGRARENAGENAAANAASASYEEQRALVFPAGGFSSGTTSPRPAPVRTGGEGKGKSPESAASSLAEVHSPTSADVAMVDGGLYWNLTERLIELARDPSPSVCEGGQKALLAAELDPTHPLLKPVLGAAAAAAAGGASGLSRGGSGDHARDVDDATRATREDLSTESPLGRRGMRASPSWHQKLSRAASRILGSPKSPAGDAGSGSAGGAGDRANGSSSTGNLEDVMRRSASALRLMSPLSNSSAMKRTATAQVPLRQMSSPRNDHASFPPAFAADGGSSPRKHDGSGSRGDAADADRPGGESAAAALRRVLPPSRVYSRSCEHFSRSLLEPPQGAQGYEGGYDDDDELYGFGGMPPLHRRLDPNKRLARRRVVEENTRRSGRAGKEQLKLTEHVASLDIEHGGVPTCVLMHPLTPTAAIADDRGNLRVWDYQTGRIINRFNAGMPGKKVASLSLVNDLDDSLLLAGGADGSVRVWRDYGCGGEQRLVMALRALPLPAALGVSAPGTSIADAAEHHSALAAPASSPVGSVSSTASFEGRLSARVSVSSRPWQTHRPKTPGVVIWQQQSGCLYAAGDTHPAPLLRVWDMTRELCLESIQTQSPGTCLTAEGALLMAGAADGAVLSYDLRTPARLLSVVQTHQSPVVSILLQPGNTSNLVVTGSVNGEMKFCDLRNAATPFHTAEVQKPAAGSKATLSALVAHDHAGIIASGSSERAVKLWDLEGNNVASIRYYNSFLGLRIGAVRSLAFHPNSLLLATGCTDAIATVYSGEGGITGAGLYGRGF